MKNVIELMQESYTTGVKLDTTEADKAAAQDKAVGIWKQWCEIPVTQTFLQQTNLKCDELIRDAFIGVLSGTITDVQLRAKITEAATLHKVLTVATEQQGKY